VSQGGMGGRRRSTLFRMGAGRENELALSTAAGAMLPANSRLCAGKPGRATPCAAPCRRGRCPGRVPSAAEGGRGAGVVGECVFAFPASLTLVHTRPSPPSSLPPSTADDAQVHADSARASPSPASSTAPPPADTPPAASANLLFTLLARSAVFDPAAHSLTLSATHRVATVVSQAPAPHAGRLPAARLANASAWTSNGTWLNGPHAVLEGTPVGGGKGVTLVLRLSSPAVVGGGGGGGADAPPLTLRFSATPATADGAGALPGGVVAYALASAQAAAVAGSADGATATTTPPPAPTAGPPLRLSDAALFIDGSAAGEGGADPNAGGGGAKQVSPYYGCYSSTLGSLAVFGSNCGGSEDWQYDPFTAGGSQYVG
jgi:hypothetical protein